MKSKSNSFFFLLILFSLLLCLSACGKNNPGSDVGGETKSFGKISVFLPEGMLLTGGSIFDSNDENELQITTPDEFVPYFLVSVKKAETAEKDLASAKEKNGGSEIESFKTGKNVWHGVAYEYNGTPCFLLIAQIKENTFEVMSEGYSHEDAVPYAVLSSLKNAK